MDRPARLTRLRADDMARHPRTGAGPAAGLGRRVVLGCALTLLVLLAWPAPAGAHGLAVLTIHGDGRGSVWVTALWQDGHPITEPVGAVLTAKSATGERIGPVALRQRGDGTGTLSYSGTLAAGEWAVEAEMGTPAIGRCTATVLVAAPGASPAPTEVRCGAVASAAAGAANGAGAASKVGAWAWLAAGLGVLAAVGVVALFASRKRPARTASRHRLR